MLLYYFLSRENKLILTAIYNIVIIYTFNQNFSNKFFFIKNLKGKPHSERTIRKKWKLNLLKIFVVYSFFRIFVVYSFFSLIFFFKRKKNQQAREMWNCLLCYPFRRWCLTACRSWKIVFFQLPVKNTKHPRFWSIVTVRFVLSGKKISVPLGIFLRT